MFALLATGLLSGCFQSSTGGPASEDQLQTGEDSRDEDVDRGESAGRPSGNVVVGPAPNVGMATPGFPAAPRPAGMPGRPEPEPRFGLEACLFENPQIDEACSDCTCQDRNCYDAIVNCNSSCVSLVGCVADYCERTEGMERTDCAIANCASFLGAADTATAAGPCFQRCLPECRRTLGLPLDDEDAGQ